jgi:hypothetical protein
VSRGRVLRLFALCALAAPAIDCGPRVVDAVDLGSTADGSPKFVWPNATSSANSDPWLAAHHDELVELQPRVLLLDFYNPWTVGQAQTLAESRIAAIAQASRYHAYSNPGSQPFLNYQLAPIVDLTDQPAPAPATRPFDASTKYPVDSTGAFDLTALFSASFASNLNVPDPKTPGRFLTLCELFEQGIVNEVWILAGDESNGARKAPLQIESKQVYDAQEQAVAGMFNPNTGYQPFTAPACAVTARLAALSPVFSLDCDLVPRWAGIENMHLALPYLDTNADDFFNDDFKTRDAAPFDSWAELTLQGAPTQVTWQYPSQTSVSGVFPDGVAWTINPFLQGCGTAHFPPNAEFEWDYTDTVQVQSRCEHYQMRDGLGGADITNLYSFATVSSYASQFGADLCGGGWQLYLPESMPGFGNQAFAADGTPMKNWWPFLFY